MRDLSTLERAEIFGRLSARDFASLLEMLPRRRLARGDVLFRQGDPGDWLAILVDGRLNVVVTRADGEKEIVRQLSPGEVVGEMACVDPEERSASVVSPWEAAVLVLDRDLLQRLRYESPRLAAGILSGIIHQVTRRIRETNQRIETEQLRLSVLLRGGAAAAVRGQAGDDLPEVAARPEADPDAIDLSRVPVLGGLTAADLRILGGLAPPRRYPAGSVLCKEGLPGASCFLLLDGLIEVRRGFGPGRQRLGILSPGTLVGQLALVDKEPRSASLITQGPALVLELERDTFERLVESASPLGLRFQDLVAVAGVRQLRMANARIAILQQPDAGEAEMAGTPPAAAPSQRAFTPEQQTRLRTIAQILGRLDTALAEWDLTVDDLRQMDLSGPSA